MDASKITAQLRLALRQSGLTLWEVARRADLGVAEVAKVLGHVKWPSVDLVAAVGHALGLELVLVEAPSIHLVSEPQTVVDRAVASVAPEKLREQANDGIRVLALDLEGTLISNDSSRVPRPGLLEFLEAVQSLFDRVVLFTSMPEPQVRELGIALLQAGSVPPWFVAVSCVRWTGLTKDLNFIASVTAEHAVLVDDTPQLVHPGQEAQWVRIRGFEPKHDAYDDELPRVLEELVDRVVGRFASGEVRP